MSDNDTMITRINNQLIKLYDGAHEPTDNTNIIKITINCYDESICVGNDNNSNNVNLLIYPWIYDGVNIGNYIIYSVKSAPRCCRILYDSAYNIADLNPSFTITIDKNNNTTVYNSRASVKFTLKDKAIIQMNKKHIDILLAIADKEAELQNLKKELYYTFGELV
jgi:hypothetical protein